jgi:hypothetical protein
MKAVLGAVLSKYNQTFNLGINFCDKRDNFFLPDTIKKKEKIFFIFFRYFFYFSKTK